MKQNRYFLTLGLLVGMTYQTIAQGLLEIPNSAYPLNFKTEVGKTTSLGKKSVESGWLSPTQLMEDYGATFAGPSFFPLFQDSTVLIIPSSQATSQVAYRNPWNLFGTVFQPNDPLYELQTSGWKFTRFTNYACDSVSFPYAYIRQVNEMNIGGSMVEVVDTVFLHFYQNKNLNTGWFFNNSDEIFSMPLTAQYDINKLGPKDVVWVDTILLTTAAATDTAVGATFQIGALASMVDARVRQIGADNNNLEDNVIGVSIAFKTMIPYKFGDTLISYNDQILPKKKMNIFGTVAYYNSGSRVVQTEYNNNSFVTNFQVRYGQSFGSLKGYMPTLQSIGWGSDFYFPASFHVTGANVSVNELAEQLGMKVYPNPAVKGENIVVTAKNITSAQVELTLMDVVGNTVYNVSEKAAGTYSIPTAKLVPGIYFVSLTADGVTATQKIVVTQ